jgi:hypothetical protein
MQWAWYGAGLSAVGAALMTFALRR